MWSVTKTCPIFSQYNENWYFYEDDNKLASKLLYPKETEKPEEGTQQTSAISEQSKGEKLNTLYVNINENLQQSYTLCQQLQDFDWSSIEYLSWQSKDENGNEHIIVMKDMLLSKEAVQLLLTQSDRCNALAVKLWLENPYKKPTDFNSQQITPAAWYRWYTTTPQLEVEIGKAQDLANNIVSDTSKKLEAIDSSLNIPGSISDAYIQEIHTKYSDYLTLLDYAIQYFESARALALEIRR